MNLIYLDTETTDIDGDVIELAWLADTGESFSQRYHPTKPMALGAILVHGILPEDLVGCPPCAGVSDHLPPCSYWIGHNIDFDWKVLGSPSHVQRICTLAIARALLPDLDSHKLGALYLHFNGITRANFESYQASAHGAGYDVDLCKALLADLLELGGALALLDDPAALWRFSEDCRIPTRMSFGKHKGKLIAEVDAGYMAWYRKQADCDPYLLEAFRRVNR